MDAAHRALVIAVFGFEALERGAFGAVAVPENARESDARLLVGRDEVRLLLEAAGLCDVRVFPAFGWIGEGRRPR